MAGQRGDGAHEPVACIVVTCSSVDMILSRPTSYLFRKVAPKLEPLRNCNHECKDSSSAANAPVHHRFTATGPGLDLGNLVLLVGQKTLQAHNLEV